MPTPTAVLKKIDAVLKKYAPVDRVVYKRLTTSSGGDSLIGRTTFSNVDTELNPQPMYDRVSAYPVGPRSKSEAIREGSSVSIGNSLELIVSASAISLDDLKNPNVSLVFKDATGDEEVFEIADYEPTGFQGTDLMYIAYIKSIQR